MGRCCPDADVLVVIIVTPLPQDLEACLLFPLPLWPWPLIKPSALTAAACWLIPTHLSLSYFLP